MPQKCLQVFLIVVMTLGALHAPSAGQSTPTAATAPTSPAADEAFKPLQREFKNLYDSLQNKGGAGKEDRPALEALRKKVTAFEAQFPDDPRGPAAELYLAVWLEDQASVDAIYGRILKTRPTDITTRLAYARSLERQNKYARVIEVLTGVTFDDAHIIDAKQMLSNALFAEQRFQEAVDALNSIPESVWASNLPRKPEVTTALAQRQEYLTLWTAEQALRAAEQKADDLPRVEIVTAHGPIVVELFENEAPNTVANFINLTEKKFYDGTKFHRVMPNFMAQGGDPNTKAGATGSPGMGNPGYYIADEVGRENARKHFTGSLAMAKFDAPDTGGCQFYITHLPTPWLNGKHTVFGRVITGEDIVRSLKPNDVIESVNVLRKRDHAYEPVTLPLVKPAATIPASMPGITLDSTIPVTTGDSTIGAVKVPATQP